MATRDANAFKDIHVRAGNDAILKIDTPNGIRVCGWATGLSWDEDHEVQGIRVLGHHGDIGFKSIGYNANVRISSFGLIPEAINDGNFGTEIKTILPVISRSNILTTGVFFFDVYDPITKNLLASLEKCKFSSNNVSIQNNNMITRETSWKCMEVIYYKDGLTEIIPSGTY